MRRLTTVLVLLATAILTGCNLDFITGAPCEVIRVPFDTAKVYDPATGDTLTAIGYVEECK